MFSISAFIYFLKIQEEKKKKTKMHCLLWRTFCMWSLQQFF